MTKLDQHFRNKEKAIKYLKEEIRIRKFQGVDTDYPANTLNKIEEENRICDCYLIHKDCLLSDLVYFER